MRPVAFKVAVGRTDHVTALLYAADPSRRFAVTLLLAHGAGAPQQSPFMVDFARGLAARGADSVTFNFLYTEQNRKAPDKADSLEKCFAAVIDAVSRRSELAGNRLAIGGKSMGGRIATHIAAGGVEAKEPFPASVPHVAGLVLLGYPLHPPGRADRLRAAHLSRIRVPMLVVQGERDMFGTADEVRPILAGLPVTTDLHVVGGGDHSFKVPASQASQQETFASVQDTIASWLKRSIPRDSY